MIIILATIIQTYAMVIKHPHILVRDYFNLNIIDYNDH
jgi:hypothetical protein